MASSKQSPSHGKKGKEEKNWKSSFARLLSSCGSGKSKDVKQKTSNSHAAPSTPPEEHTWTRINEDANVNKEVVAVNATPGHSPDDDEVEITYTDLKEIGQGTFGIVYRARLCETGELLAIKKTLDDPKFKNRELMMMRQLEHPNILNLRYFFYTTGYGYKKNERYLNMVLDYIPETLFSVAKCDGTYTKPLLEPLYVKLYTYQVFRSLVYLHSLHISHRDVKPQNLLLDPETHVIKLCDFGSAKELSKGDTNVAYICSRYYRAPELILGSTDYTCQIDVWSAGCVLAELFQGHPIFPGANGPDQMVEIIKILGTPSLDDLADINHKFMEFRFPYLAPHPWLKVLKNEPSAAAVDLIGKVLVYAPSKRITPIEALAHPFYDELRMKGTRLKNGRRLPPLFNFKPEELEINPTLNSKLMPNFDEDDDIDYVESTMNMTPEVENSTINPPSRLESFRSSFKKKLPKISIPKRGSLKRGDKSDARDEFEKIPASSENITSAEGNEVQEMDHEVKYDEHEDIEDLNDVSGNQTGDMSASYPVVHVEPHKAKGKRSKRANNSGHSGEFVDSFTSSANQSYADNTEAMVADMESLEIQVPKKRKGKRKQKARKESTDGDEDTTMDDTQQEMPYASTPVDQGEGSIGSPPATPPLPNYGEPKTTTSSKLPVELHSNDSQDAGVTRKIKKKTTKKKSSKSNAGDGTTEHTVVTETVVVTSMKEVQPRVSDF